MKVLLSYIKIEFNFEGYYQIKENIIEGKKFSLIEGKELNIRIPGQPSLPGYDVSVGIPHNAVYDIKVLDLVQEKITDTFILPTPDSLNQSFELLPYDVDIYNSDRYFPQFSAEIQGDAVIRFARIIYLSIAPYQFNPITRDLLFNKKIVIQIDFKVKPNDYTVINKIQDKVTDDLLRSTVINYDIARQFVGKPVLASVPQVLDEPYWYDPQKDYYKIYLNKKGVYRITYEMLTNTGVPANRIQEMNFELFNDGVSIPIDVVDVNEDGLFNQGDYFQFIGSPPKPLNQFTRMNIYNNQNVYWFSYQADTTNYYKYINGYKATSSPIITNTILTLKWERDSSYQRFGLAPNDQRDFWQWNYAEARNRLPFRDFIFYIQDSIAYRRVIEKPDVKIRVGLHGLTNTSCPENIGHDVTVKFNGKILGVKQWNSQEAAVFEKDFFIAANSSFTGDTAQIFADKQKFEINLYGNICEGYENDYVFINYIEFDYWRWNRTFGNYFYFTSPPNNFEENRYYLWRWAKDNMKIYIPERGEVMDNPYIVNDADGSVYFVDTISVQTDYYCVADDYYLLPDSMIQNIPSDLRNPSNSADYIIITHPLFQSAAERLADYRTNNLTGYSTPRVKIVNVFDIYNEFSFGLLSPYALQYFAKYAFENWQQPAPAYIVLLGDASYDTRKVYSTSRKNYIPSIPYHASQFGQLPSDNLIASVQGDDISPDLALGRLSCETLDEANILVDKIINYPADISKPWKENVILLASGLNYEDQINLGFNDRSKELENSFLLPNGITGTKVFNFPEPEDIAFWGDGPRMREEINNGAAIVNYYGHGGGAQWDLIFTKDDIPELHNGSRLPLVSSITCYTAFFDNAESFGEIFVKIPNKGAIGFWGSTGLTWWPTGHYMNAELFRQIFNYKNNVIGNAILNAKASVGGGTYDAMIAQLSYLGDPAIELAIPKLPDFEIRSSDISILPANPLKEDTVKISLSIRNLGVIFPSDSVTIEFFINNTDTSNLIQELKLPSFGYSTTVSVDWIPKESGLYSIIARINEKNIIDEIDHSDNIASNSFSVFDFGEPNIIKPVNGYFHTNDKIEFIISDIGFYFDRSFNYLIQISDEAESFEENIFISSPVLNSVDGIVRWQSPSLSSGEYFWRAVIYDNIDTNYSPVQIFSITTTDGSGYLSHKKHLQLFEVDNLDYSELFNSLVLNTELKPPHPEDKFLIDSVMISVPADSTEPSTFTTDGTYFYFAHLPVFTNGALTKIYKVGTGLNGTIAGENYGAIPNLSVNIFSHLMHHDGYLYTCTGSLNSLLKINPQTGDTIAVPLTDSLLLTVATATQIGGVFLYSDGQYVYNLAVGTSLYRDKFVLRIFDPSNNWEKIGEDILFSGNIIRRVSSFIVVNGYLIVYENYSHIYLRRYRLSDGAFEEEWRYSPYAKDYYAIAYDYLNNFVFFSAFRPGTTPYDPGFFKYRGTYIEANGTIASQEIGPASKWNNLQFEIDQTNSNGTYKAFLWGKNRTSGEWIVLDTLTQSYFSLENLSVNEFNYIKLNFELIDSSFGAGEPIKFNSLKVNFDYLPEISMLPKDMTFLPDSILQGFDINMNLKVNNLGYIPVDSLRLDFYLNEGDTILFTKFLSVKPDSFTVLEHLLETNKIIFENKLKVVATSPVQEYYTYNNLIGNSFFVTRDSLQPTFQITFDGKEIIDGDIISSKPTVVITLEDNSPLPLTQNLFSIVHDNIPLKFDNPDLTFIYTPYPNSRAEIIWTPELDDGKHTLEVLAKDSSGNFFDSTSNRSVFYVYNNADILNVYNYPNPFSDNTQFTFELRGTLVPEELRIKIYTIAGRLIREINIPPGQMNIGFNQYYWDGKDQDGDEIANGLYFYKVITRHEGETKTVTQKLAKVK